jgi:hypothetical protein
MRKAVFGRKAPGLPISDTRIVNYRIEPAEPIDLIGHAAGLGNAPQIADDNGLRSGYGGQRFLPAPLVAGVQDHAMPLFDE